MIEEAEDRIRRIAVKRRGKDGDKKTREEEERDKRSGRREKERRTEIREV